MLLSDITKKQIEAKLGKEIRYPSDYEVLSLDIQKNTGERVSCNTLKRLFGAIGSVAEPRLYTLDVIARYLGYENWDVYLVSLAKDGNSEFGQGPIDPESCKEIVAGDLAKGARLEFQYFPDRRVVVEKTEGNAFKVVESENSKLALGDAFIADGFYLNYPLIVMHVFRDGTDLGRFTAGKISGITYLKILK